MAERREAEKAEGSRDPYHHGDLRAALLRSAEAELAEKGVEGFTLRGCAKRAGVSHAAPTYHFGDADGLLTALATEGFQRFTLMMRARIERESGMEPTDAAGLGYLDFALGHPALFRLMFTSRRPNGADPVFAAACGEAFGVLVKAMGEKRGADPMADRGGLADLAAAWALVHGLAELMLSGQLAFFGEALTDDRDSIAALMFSRLRTGSGRAS